MTKAVSSSWALTSRHMSSAYTITETVLENGFLGLRHLDTDKKSSTIVPDLCEPHITDDVLRQLDSEASNPTQNRAVNVWWLPLRLLAVFAAWRVEAFFFLCGTP